MYLPLIRPLVTAAEAAEAVAAYEALDRAEELQRRIGEQGNAAHQAPRVIRRRHHDLVVADLLAGREPDDSRLWADVIAADDELERHKARHAASQVAVGRAKTAVEAAVRAAGATLLPWAAKNRPTPVPGAWEEDTGRTRPWDMLLVSFNWPALPATPAVDHQDFFPRYTRWWPLVSPADYKFRLPEQVEFSEDAWAQLAAGSFSISDGVLTFARPWKPSERRSSERRFRPVVFLDSGDQRIA